VSDTLDMTAMRVMHDALRREAEHLAKVTGQVGRHWSGLKKRRRAAASTVKGNTRAGVASGPCLDARPGTHNHLCIRSKT
jgi:hypothetical protein